MALSQAQIERLEKRQPIEEILSLAPLQEGLLFHALYDAQGHDVYTVQMSLQLEGRVEEERMRLATQALVQRHANLRQFEHEDLDTPVQVIARQVELPWTSVDLSMLDEATEKVQLEEWLRADQARQFDPAKPPLLRFALIRLRGQRHCLVLTESPYFAGWVVAAPAVAGGDGVVRAGESAPGYSVPGDLGWIARQDRAATEAVWREEMAELRKEPG